MFGSITGAINAKINQGQTADWAARGQPIFERWLDKQSWFIETFPYGAIVGAIVGIIWAYVERDIEQKGEQKKQDEKKVKDKNLYDNRSKNEN